MTNKRIIGILFICWPIITKLLEVLSQKTNYGLLPTIFMLLFMLSPIFVILGIIFVVKGKKDTTLTDATTNSNTTDKNIIIKKNIKNKTIILYIITGILGIITALTVITIFGFAIFFIGGFFFQIIIGMIFILRISYLTHVIWTRYISHKNPSIYFLIFSITFSISILLIYKHLINNLPQM